MAELECELWEVNRQPIEHEQSPRQVYLQPGELFLAREPTIIQTILGSCVGATFWSARLGVGALSHSQLPTSPKNPSAPLSLATGRRYVDFAIRDLVRQFREIGAFRTEVEIKLFGGADVLLVGKAEPSRPTIGRLNCEAAMEALRAEGLNAIASCLGGTLGCKIQFDTRSGEVLLRRLT